MFLSIENLTHLKLLAESVGAVELHDVLHKLLHSERLVAVWNQRTNISENSVTAAFLQDQRIIVVPVASSSGVDGTDRTLGDAVSSG